jgi:hypothetical protein
MVAKGDARTLFYESQKLKIRVTRVFEAVERLVGARPGHKLEVNFRGMSLERTVRSASRQVALGFTAGFAMLASAVTATSERVTGWVPVAFGIASAVFTLALVADLWLLKGRNTWPK